MEAVVGSSALLTLIIAWIYVPPTEKPTVAEKEAYTSLSRCARVNKLWHVESCRFLWKQHGKLEHVLKLFTPDISLLDGMERSRYDTAKISLTRFLQYSKWIRNLACGDLKDSDVIKNACLLAEGTPLFPHLETLKLDGIPGASSITALALLGPKLKVISFNDSCPATGVSLILERLALRSIRLSKLWMRNVTTTSRDEQRCLFDVLSRQQSLLDLHLHPSWVDCDVFCAVASLPKLGNLEICHNIATETPLAASTLYDSDAVLKLSKQRELWFPSLTNLTLYIHWLSGIELVKSVCINTAIKDLELWLQLRTGDQLGSALTFLPSSLEKSLSALEDMDIQVSDADAPLIPRLTAASFKPLSNSSLLRILTIRVARIPQMDDTVLLTLIKNWPHLSKLRFIDLWSVSRGDRCNFSLALIVKIPTICQELSSLWLPAVSYSGESLDIYRPQNQKLQFLNLGISFFFDSQDPEFNETVMFIAAYLAAVTSPSCRFDFYDMTTELPWHAEIPDAEWDILMTAHQQTTLSIRSHIRSIRMSQGIAAALNDEEHCVFSRSQNDPGFSCA